MTPVPTRRLLLRHLAGLLVLSAVAAATLLPAYLSVQRTPNVARSRTAPAIQQIAAARIALDTADRSMRRTVRAEVSQTVGPGEEFRTQLSAADQSLSRAAEIQLAGDEGDGIVAAVDGLLSAYSDSVNQGTGRYADRPWMREHKLGEAESLLRLRTESILPRLDDLQRRQQQRAAEELSVTRWQKVLWAAALLSLLGVAAVLVSALAVLRRRCGRLFNFWLALGVVLAAVLLVVPVLFAYQTQSALSSVQRLLEPLTERGGDVAGTSRRVLAALDGAHSTRGPLVVFGCGLLALALAPAGELWRRLRTDYGRRTP